MRAERPPSALETVSDDQLGTIAVSLVVSELQWTPDVAPAVMDRISRDVVTYPEQFDRRPGFEGRSVATRVGGASMTRTMSRVIVIAVIIMLVAALVVVAATTNADVTPVAASVAIPPFLEAP